MAKKQTAWVCLRVFLVLETPMHLEDSRAGKRATFIYFKKPI
jgi:hypothetical protein